MIGNDTERYVDFFLFTLTDAFLCRQRRAVLFAAQFLEFVKDRAKDVGLVVRDGSGKIGEILCALDDRCNALEAHAGVDVSRRERDKRCDRGHRPGYRVRVELDENEVPDLDAPRIALVHQRATRVAVRREIDVQLGARDRTGRCRPSSRSCPSCRRYERGSSDRDRPRGTDPPRDRTLPGQTRSARPGLGLVNRRVEPLRRKFPALDDEFPRPLDRFLFEVVTEGPVPEHFEERVVIGVEPDILQVVVLAASADALLRIRTRAGFHGRFLLSKEDRHELIHARVREK